MKDSEKDRLEEIQDRLLEFIQPELRGDDDFMYMATMLLKHSMVLYQTFLDPDSIREMLQHVGENLEDNFSITYLDEDWEEDDPSATRH